MRNCIRRKIFSGNCAKWLLLTMSPIFDQFSSNFGVSSSVTRLACGGDKIDETLYKFDEQNTKFDNKFPKFD